MFTPRTANLCMINGLSQSLQEGLRSRVANEKLIEDTLRTYSCVTKAFWKAISNGTGYSDNVFVRPPAELAGDSLLDKPFWNIATNGIKRDADAAGWEVTFIYKDMYGFDDERSAHVHVRCKIAMPIRNISNIYQIPTCINGRHRRSFTDYIPERALVKMLRQKNVNVSKSYYVLLYIAEELDILVRFGRKEGSFNSKGATRENALKIVEAFNEFHVGKYSFECMLNKDKFNLNIQYTVKLL